VIKKRANTRSGTRQTAKVQKEKKSIADKESDRKDLISRIFAEK